MKQFDYRVAIRIPVTSRDAANQTVADITGNPVDLQTFTTRITNNNEIQYLAEIWMREQYFQQLDDFQIQLGGEYAVMSQRINGQWKRIENIWSWLEQSGFRLVETVE